MCFLRIVFTEPMKQIERLWPGVQPKVYVDDILLQVQGRRQDVARDGIQVTKDCIERLAEVGLEVSRGTAGSPGGKSAAVTPCPEVRRSIEPAMRKLGIAVAEHHSYLGVDLTASRTTRQLVRESRRRLWGRRVEKITKLGKAGRRRAVRGGVRKVLKTGLIPSFLYGSKCLGVRPSDVKRCRVDMARLVGYGRGSTTIKLAFRGLEPGPTFSAPPVAQWAQKT